MKQLAITSSLMKYWKENYHSGLTTIYPGMQVDTAGLTAWVEWRAEFWKRYVQRVVQKELLKLSVQVHLYSKETSNEIGMHQLVDYARETFSQATMPVYEYGEVGEPVVGYVSLHEPEIRDLSRDDLNKGKHRLRHSLIEWTGIAQEI